MRFLLPLFFLPCALFAQRIEMDIYTAATDSGYQVFIDNREVVPITVEVELILDNMLAPAGATFRAVVPAATLGHPVADLQVDDPGAAFGLEVSVRSFYGHQDGSGYDTAYVYRLPFAEGSSFRVEQGYDGAFSHRGKQAIDFGLPLGTPVHAARGGVVAALSEEHDRSCHHPECMQYNNYVHIYHDDGTIADYAHLRYRGVTVAVGDRVAAGDLIGYSGATGFTNGPHLHFVVYLPRGEGQVTVPTRFRTSSGIETDLREGAYYGH